MKPLNITYIYIYDYANLQVEEVRGSNISLKNRLAKLEQALRNKDELAENLHVIDFEQLKIENQQLNEKIEERNEELHKLRKKTIVTVQIITHMREKVQFVQKEYQILKEELAQLDQDLGAQRDLVTKTKHERDEHRQEYASLKQQTGIMNSEHLTKDFKDAGRFKCIWDGYYRPRMFMVTPTVLRLQTAVPQRIAQANCILRVRRFNSWSCSACVTYLVRS
ncbi:unnamed protein product [Durusdinium trenchii]|uniref:CCDC113/CCDC96 coiled-coil domain-containing protein n=1 Tax=Durusdinium trenchii TaxID=1381693 RepID=A0ABP0L2X2_9DINO